VELPEEPTQEEGPADVVTQEPSEPTVPAEAASEPEQGAGEG